MNVKLLTKEFFIKRGGEQLNELEDKTKVDSFIKLPKSVNDYMGDKGQTKNFKFSSVDDDMFDDKSGPSGHFAFSFNQPKGLRALDEFYDEMLPSIDYSGELPEYYEYKLHKGKTTNDRIVDKLRENAIDEEETQLPEIEQIYPQIKAKKGEAFERFKAQVEKYNAETERKETETTSKFKLPSSLTTGTLLSRKEMNSGGREGGEEIVIQPVNKYRKESKEERQHKLRGEKITKLNQELEDIEAGRKPAPSSKKPSATSPSLTSSTSPSLTSSTSFRRPSGSNLSETPAPSPPPPNPSENDDVDEEEAEKEELKQTPKKTPEQIKKEFIDRLEEKSKAATELDKYLNSATNLENEIKKLESDKNFKNMKASALQMTTYNNLKRNNIINVKYAQGRKNVKLSTILQNIQVSSNLRGLREDKDKKEKEKSKDREEESKHSFGAPRTTIRTLIGGGGGGGSSESTSESIRK